MVGGRCPVPAITAQLRLLRLPLLLLLAQALLGAPWVWHVQGTVSSFLDLERLCRLPALRSLTLVVAGQFLSLDEVEVAGMTFELPGQSAAIATLALARRALPRLERLLWVDGDEPLEGGVLVAKRCHAGLGGSDDTLWILSATGWAPCARSLRVGAAGRTRALLID